MFEDNETKTSITVLGKTFSSEEERRNYFREELRKKLPELKKMEGFPIGEDEDILNLSDPPYYTACPNPWLNDFITEWEEEKKELEKQGKRKPDFEVTEPYATDVSEGKNNPIYNAHSYHTKVPHPAIMRYILHYTQPGDIVFDGFAGTGMTGVAASLVEKRQDKLISPYGEGKRFSICGDLSPIASLISNTFSEKPKTHLIRNELNNIINSTEAEIKWMYEVEHDNNVKGVIDNTIWSDVFLCENCQKDLIFWDAVVDYENKVVDSKEIYCPYCNHLHNRSQLERKYESNFDNALNKVTKSAVAVPVLIEYRVGKKRYKRKPNESDIELINRINNLEEDKFTFPKNRMMIGREARRNDKLGITHSHHYYSKRNLYTLSVFYSKIKESPHFIEHLPILTASIARATLTNRFRFRGTGGLSGTLYIPSLKIERAVIPLLKSKAKDIYKAEMVKNWSARTNLVSTQSTSNYFNLSDNSIDYIFTDPPFGSNIYYSELNFLTEEWMNIFENISKEAIENTGHNKSFNDYINIMSECFRTYFRVLKPGKWMTVEFSNTSATVWNGIQTTLQNAGFIISNVAGLDRKQGSFKTVTTATAVKQDLIISCYKPSSEFDQRFKQNQHSEVAVWDFVGEHLQHLPVHLVKDNSTTAIVERSPKILFDRMVAFYVQRGLPVPIDAAAFQKDLRERFIERDGMFFTNEQVQEYDRKKAEVPNFVQMSIFVNNEQDAILWLRNLLDKSPKTEQDLHPLWMKEVAGNMRKGDSLPEMRTILEENFLKDDAGKWYVPDPENEADLEKLRNNRLLKQFKSILHEVKASKKKIKEVRLEALRAGFKHCYQESDFKTIIEVGDRIPNQLLMEDEVLLQFYDIANSKV